MRISYAAIILIATVGNSFLTDPWWAGALLGFVASAGMTVVMFIISLSDDSEFRKSLKDSHDRHRRGGRF